jgi:two-component system, cell cycle response regulator DivK
MAPKGCILVVDDHTDSREMLVHYLRQNGFIVVVATNSTEALQQAEAERPHVVLMDLALPGVLDGWETTRQLKAHPRTRDVVVLAVTAHSHAAAHEKALFAGCKSVFVKPLDLPALAQEIERLCAIHRPPRD